MPPSNKNDSAAIDRLVAGLEAANRLFHEERALADDRARAQRRLEQSVHQLYSIISTGHKGNDPVIVQLAKLRNDIDSLKGFISELKDVSKSSSEEFDVLTQFVNKDIMTDHESRLRTIENWKSSAMGGKSALFQVITFILSLAAIIATAIEALYG